MKILRIENPLGYGIHSYKKYHKYPYNLNIRRSQYLKDGTERKQHPDTESFWSDITKDHYYGFEKKEHLDIWCSPVEIGWYLANDFKINVYEIDERYVLKGKRQVAFLKHKAILIGEYKRKHKL